jgi:hypothetical protein
MNRPALFTNAHFPTRQPRQAGSVLVEDGKIRFWVIRIKFVTLRSPRRRNDLAGKTVLPVCAISIYTW